MTVEGWDAICLSAFISRNFPCSRWIGCQGEERKIIGLKYVRDKVDYENKITHFSNYVKILKYYVEHNREYVSLQHTD